MRRRKPEVSLPVLQKASYPRRQSISAIVGLPDATHVPPCNGRTEFSSNSSGFMTVRSDFVRHFLSSTTDLIIEPRLKLAKRTLRWDTIDHQSQMDKGFRALSLHSRRFSIRSRSGFMQNKASSEYSAPHFRYQVISSGCP